MTILLFAFIPSAMEILNYGNGDCGSSLMRVSILPVYVMLIVLLYETIKFIKFRLGSTKQYIKWLKLVR